MKLKQIYNILVVGFTLLGMFSCNNEDISTITAIKLTSSNAQLLIDQEFSFEVKANNSEIVTGDAIIRVDGETITNGVFSSSEPGEFEVQAFYQDMESEIVNISAVYPSGYIQNVLVEDYTGTWCVNCPKLSWAIELAKQASDKVVSVGIHAYDTMEMSGYEVLTDEFTDDEYGITIYPTGMINRINTWDNVVQNTEAVTNLTGYGAPLGLSINSSVNGTNIDATIEVGFYEDVAMPLRLVVYLTENGLIYDQQNSTEYYGGPGLAVDFEHNDVLRAIYTNHLGENIPAAQTVIDNVYSLSLQKAIPTSVFNNDQLHLVAFVTDADTNEVINVREVKVGEEQELQEL